MRFADASRDKALRREPTSREEIQSLLRLAERDLYQAEIPGLYPDGRFAFAYNAALQLATACLRLHHIRIGSRARHARTFQELKKLLPPEKQHFALDFDRARRKRNTLMYDQAGAVSEHEAMELLAEVREFQEWLLRELKARFPQYAPEDE